MPIAIGCDHRGFGLKQAIMTLLKEMGQECADFGCYGTALVDYPDLAGKVAEAVSRGEVERGILICSTGIGMSIAANKVRGVRAAVSNDTFSARRARQHNDANVLCLGASIVGQDLAEEIVRIFFSTEFEGGRHSRRLEKIATIESTQ